MNKNRYSWNTFSALMGPVYFIISGRYFIGFNIIAAVLLLTYWFPAYGKIISVITAISCGFTANYYCEKSLNNKHLSLIKKLEDKGFHGDALRRELRLRERSGIRNFLKMGFGILSYWGFIFIASTLIFIKVQVPDIVDELDDFEMINYEFMYRMKEDLVLTEEEKSFVIQENTTHGDSILASAHHLELAKDYYKNRKLLDCSNSILHAYLLNQSDYEVYWLAGNLLYSQELVSESIIIMGYSLQLNPFNSELKSDIGKAYSRRSGSLGFSKQDRLEYSNKGSRYLKEANHNSPYNEYIYSNWAEALYWKGNYVQAVETLKKIESFGGIPNPHVVGLVKSKYNYGEP